jgi:hypothetical protein
MRESRTYGSVRGARDEIGVPTATREDEAARVHHPPGGAAAAWPLTERAHAASCTMIPDRVFGARN